MYVAQHWMKTWVSIGKHWRQCILTKYELSLGLTKTTPILWEKAEKKAFKGMKTSWQRKAADTPLVPTPRHESSIFRSVIQPMMEQVRLCTVCLMENWLGTSKTKYRVGWMIWICYSCALERKCLERRSCRQKVTWQGWMDRRQNLQCWPWV